jgi:hypothetical protein
MGWIDTTVLVQPGARGFQGPQARTTVPEGPVEIGEVGLGFRHTLSP